MEEEFNARRQKDETPVAGWEVIYCSLALILVAFFAMLVSYSTVEGQKMENFLRGFAVSSEKSMIDGISSSNVMRRLMVSTGGNEGIEGGKVLQPSRDVKKGDQTVVMLAMNSLKTVIENGGSYDDVQLVKTEKGFKATFGSHVLFPSGSATISKAAFAYLDEMIKILHSAPFSIRVEGHTDNVPIATETFPSNWELSTVRAVNVLRYFLSAGQISPQRIAAVGFSEYHPVAPNHTPEGKAKNRRVEFNFDLAGTPESI